jgi:hypothetical protein
MLEVIVGTFSDKCPFHASVRVADKLTGFTTVRSLTNFY